MSDHLPRTSRPRPNVAALARTCTLTLAVALPAQSPVGAKRHFPRCQLSVDTAALGDLRFAPGDRPHHEGTWTGRFSGARVEVSLRSYARAEYRAHEPEAVEWVESVAHGPGNAPTAQRACVTGEFGYVPYALLLADAAAVGPASDDTKPAPATGTRYRLFGLTPSHGFALHVEVAGEVDPIDASALETFWRTGIRSDGPARDPRWTIDEATARWRAHAPADTHAQLTIHRTAHYLILTNASGSLFPKKMEEFYERIRKVYPFAEAAGRRLLPVFLFRTREQYYTFCDAVAGERAPWLRQSKGHASDDYYATWYEAPNDPVHIHEATHQIFQNRLFLTGGGSWFQEGVAEYVSESANDLRSVVRPKAREGSHVPFAAFVVTPRLLTTDLGDDRKGGSRTGHAYAQAASIVAFLAESPFGKARFAQFVHAMGRTHGRDLTAIEATLRRVYDVDLAGLEQRWRTYWSR